jgi:hypothetical protein
VDDFVVDFQFDAAEARISYVSSLRTILHDALPRSLSKSAVVRSGTVATVGCHPQLTTRVTLDTGADSGSYIGGDAIRALGSNVATEPCRHRVRLGDGKTMVTVHQIVYVDIQLEDNYGDYTDPITTAFYVVPTLGNEVIVGLPDILGNYFDHLSEFIYAARQDRLESSASGVISRLDSICDRFTEELSRVEPRIKRRIVADQSARMLYVGLVDGDTVELISSDKYGSVYADFRVQNILAAIEDTTAHVFKELPFGSLQEQWVE